MGALGAPFVRRSALGWRLSTIKMQMLGEIVADFFSPLRPVLHNTSNASAGRAPLSRRRSSCRWRRRGRFRPLRVDVSVNLSYRGVLSVLKMEMLRRMMGVRPLPYSLFRGMLSLCTATT
jgi:hypothetical protein